MEESRGLWLNADNKKRMKKMFQWVFVIPIASLIYATGISLFLDPNQLAPGGITGISIILNRFTNIDTGTLILVLNLPLLAIAWIKFGFYFVMSSLYALSWISFFSNFLQRLEPVTGDLFLAAVGGGVCMSLGLGIILRIGATTGGTDIVVKLIRLKYKHIRTGKVFLMVDLCVLALSFIAFRQLETVMYAGLAIGLMSVVLDWVLYGRDEAKMLYVISEKEEEIAAYFMRELDMGVTFLQGKGAYSGQTRKILLCVIRNRLAPFAQEAVKEIDPYAFMIVTSANEIFGNGYKKF